MVMLELESKILPYLFVIIGGFILINLMMNLCLYSFSKIKNIKMLCWFWAGLFLSYALQGFFQTGELPIVLSYSVSVIPSVLIAVIIFDTVSKKAPVKLYLKGWALALIVTPFLLKTGLDFTLISMPMSLALGFIPLNTAYHILRQDGEKATSLQKFMAVLMFFTFIHFINFSLFRMRPGTQVLGHSVSLAIYQIYSISVFALALENFSRKEKERLQELVDMRTQELSKALSVKATLFRMVLHDIAAPIQGQLWAIQLLKENRGTKINLLDKLSDMTNLIKNVVEQVRTIEALNSGNMYIEKSPVNLDLVLADLSKIYEDQLKVKNIELEINNTLPPGTMFFADQTVFTTSVLGNLVSNGIKFSHENSKLVINAFERNDKVILELEDKGIGMPQEMAFTIFDPDKKISRKGTLGETGTGFGMVQVKSYIEHFGGEISVESRPMDLFPDTHGTKITLAMNKSDPVFLQ